MFFIVCILIVLHNQTNNLWRFRQRFFCLKKSKTICIFLYKSIKLQWNGIHTRIKYNLGVKQVVVFDAACCTILVIVFFLRKRKKTLWRKTGNLCYQCRQILRLSVKDCGSVPLSISMQTCIFKLQPHFL